jgi:putative ABC transport system ATP-binding protein
MIPYGPTPLVSTRSLSHLWPDARAALALEDFDVAAGERLFLCGDSGSGKSTLLGLLSGVLMPAGGDVLILGQSLATLRAAARDRFRAEHIGYIFQQFNLLPFLDPVENVLLGCAWSKARSARVGASRAAVRSEAHRLLGALGIDEASLLHKKTGALSVGQQQRVAAARALIGGPELLLADEPTSALDSGNRDAFLRLLLTECQRHGTGVVFVSHDMTLAKHFDRTVRLNPAPSEAMEA